MFQATSSSVGTSFSHRKHILRNLFRHTVKKNRSVLSMVMAWPIYFACLSFVSVNAINRPVYKIVLTQKGYAQFLQYDIETPPIREFTFCTWIRVYDLGNDQNIFAYVEKGNNRVMRLWLDTGGHYMKISINGKVMSSFPVDIVKDVWRHVCLSYQSDYGAWALYIDSRLISCEAAQGVYGFILPQGGSVIIGYGTAHDGAPNGLEGEIFGTNMILTSTIERNYTMREDPLFEQKLFPKNKVKDEDKSLNNYIILSDLQTDEIHNNYEKTFVSPTVNTTKSYIKFKTPYSFIEHNVGVDMSSNNPKVVDNSEEKEFLDFNTDKFRTTEKDRTELWNLVNKAGSTGKFNIKTESNIEMLGSDTQKLSTVSEFETPPPPGPPSIYFDNSLENDKQSFTESIYKPKESSIRTNPSSQLSEIETPPPINKNTKVYGQWTSSKYAGTVLNYLKSINFQPREKNTRKIPSTIPLSKISDSYPYASDFKITKLRPPPQFSRRNILEKRYDTVKKNPQINVQILDDDLRSNILKIHAQTRPKQVEITNRGQPKKKIVNRFYRNVDYDSVEKIHSVEGFYKPQPFKSLTDKKNHRNFNELSTKKYNSVLPFLKSLEYLLSDSEKTESQAVVHSEDMYSKSLANANKWHNIKSYNNDYTPRRINMDSEETETYHKQQHPSIRLKYKHEKKRVEKDDDLTIVKGRQLASEVSNQSNDNKDAVSLLKYNHGFLPIHDNKVRDKMRMGPKTSSKQNMDTHGFNKHVKLGNALNERHVLGGDENQKKQSFVGGFENVPDINRYRSDIDNEDGRVPSSLGPKVCKNVELYDRVLYVQQDESIDMTHILSPVRAKNLAIEFILQNYKKCSLAESFLEKNSKIFIDWSKTPVRLFGGAYPKTTTDLCGFF